MRAYIKAKEEEELQEFLAMMKFQRSCEGSKLVGHGKGPERDSAEEVDKEEGFQNLG